MLNKYKLLTQGQSKTSSKKSLSKTNLKSSSDDINQVNTQNREMKNLKVQMKHTNVHKKTQSQHNPKENLQKGYHRDSVDILVKSANVSGSDIRNLHNTPKTAKKMIINKMLNSELKADCERRAEKISHCVRDINQRAASGGTGERGGLEKSNRGICKDNSSVINISHNSGYVPTYIKAADGRGQKRGSSMNSKKLKSDCKSSKHSSDKLHDPRNQIETNIDPFLRDRKKLIEFNKNWFKTSEEPPKTTLDHYSFVKLIGKGAFGNVTLGIHKLTGKYVAIKTIEKRFMKDEFSRRKVFQEVYILKKIRHANVIRLLEVFEDSEHMLIVMEFAAGGDLLKYVRERGPLPEAHGREIFRQVVYGLGHIHSRSVLHRDIKLDNILLDIDEGVKICDFGVSKIVSKDDIIKEQCGTPAYIAPEVISNEGYQGFYIDHWSLGILLYAMLTANVPFKAKNMEELLEVIRTKRVAFPVKLSETAMDLIKSLLKLNPRERLSIPEILSHPWMQTEIKDELCEGNSSMYVNSKDCTNVEENLPTSINVVNIKNLFFRDIGVEKLTYVDYCIIENDMYTHRIDDNVIKKMEEFGYPRKIVVEGLQKGTLNHATATYNLLVLP